MRVGELPELRWESGPATDQTIGQVGPIPGLHRANVQAHGPILRLFQEQVSSPLGPVLLVSSQSGLVALDFDESRLHLLLRRRFFDFRLEPGGSFAGAVTAYFYGSFRELSQAPLDLGGTPFQRREWSALREIPVGQTRSYAQLAALLGNPKASRAVGLANALNPISLAIPCHRLVGSSGKLTGYAGGLERKAWLLRHEGAI